MKRTKGEKALIVLAVIAAHIVMAFNVYQIVKSIIGLF